MFTLRPVFICLSLTLLLATSSAASALIFQPTSVVLPPAYDYQPLMSGGQPIDFSSLVGSGSVQTANSIDLTTPGGIFVSITPLPSAPISNGNTNFQFLGGYTVTGTLSSATGVPSVPVTLTAWGGSISGSLEQFAGNPTTWGGALGAVVTEVSFPAGVPASDVQYYTALLGNLSQYSIDGHVRQDGTPDGGESLYIGLSANPTNWSPPPAAPVPEPSALTVVVLASSAFALRRYLDRRRTAGKKPLA